MMKTGDRFARRLGMKEGDEQLALIGEAAVFWMQLGRFDEALCVFEGLSELAPRDACSAMGATEAYLRLGRFEDAERAALEGLARVHVSPRSGRYLYLMLGEARFALGQYDAAQDAWTTAMELAPDSVEADVARRFAKGAERLIKEIDD